MSKPNEERDIYYIPPNFLTSGRLFGGMIRARNAIPSAPTKEELDAEYDRICRSFDVNSEQRTVDRFNRRWILCEECSEIKQETQMAIYGGIGRMNRGLCSSCSRKGRGD